MELNNIMNIKYSNNNTNNNNNIYFSMLINNEIVYCNILEDENDKNYIIIKGNIKNPNNYTKMAIMAPNPIDKITSFSGKALPYPCEMIAFENTPNFKIINKDGIIDIVMKYPNSYYINMGTIYI